MKSELQPNNRIFYGRVSTADQCIETQRREGERLGCSRFFLDVATGTNFDRPEYNKMIEFLRPGDAVVVWKIDRLGRNLKETLRAMWAMKERGVHVISTTQGIDTSTPMGEAFFTMAGIFAQMERDYISERTKAAIARKKELGIHCGRPSVYDPEKFELYRHMLEDKGMHHKRVQKLVGFSEASYRRYRARIASGELK